MYPVPEHVFNWWKQHPNSTGAELARATGLPERSGSRYRRYLAEGTAYSVKSVPRVQSKHLEEVAAIEETFDVEEFFERAPKLIAMQQARDPIVTHDIFTIDTERPIGIMFASCSHLGGRYTAYPEFRELYHRALNIKNLYWGALGDDLEGFLAYFSDIRSIEDQLLNPTNQLLCLEALLTPIAESNRLLFGCGGQHFSKWERKHTGNDSVKELYVKLGVPYFEGVGYCRINLGEQTYFIALAHELPGKSELNPNYSHAKASKYRFPGADIVVAGDKHSPAFQWLSSFPDEFEIGNRASPEVLYIQSGTMKTGPDPYTIHSFPKGQMGWPIVVLHPDRRRIEITPFLDRAEEMLGE